LQQTDLFPRLAFDTLSVFCGQRLKPPLKFQAVEERDGKKTDAAMGATLTTRKIVEEIGLGAIKPLSSLSKEKG